MGKSSLGEAGAMMREEHKGVPFGHARVGIAFELSKLRLYLL